jgi:hypothetical protein
MWFAHSLDNPNHDADSSFFWCALRQLCVAVNDLDEDHRHQVAESSDTLPTSYSRNARSFNYGGSDNDLLTESLLPSDQGLRHRESMYV